MDRVLLWYAESPMLNFCTLFDSVYLSRGLAMYESLCCHCQEFHLYVFAFNDVCYTILKSLRLNKMTVISLSEFEDDELLRVKPVRTRGEYCWTCTSSTILYVLNRFNVESCTYLDSDLYFFSSPQYLFDEMGNNAVMITPHNYTPQYDQSGRTGIYCVQFVTFKNNQQGRVVLEWWRKACLDWCYNRFEDNRFGDQKYLDDWPNRFEGVHVCKNLGAGVAPWNMQQYTFQKKKDRIVGVENLTGNTFDVVFFHFHSLAFVTPSYFSPRPYYRRNKSAILLMFNPYVKKIKEIRDKYPAVSVSEKYLSGFDRAKYFFELFVRRGWSEFSSIRALHK